MENLKCIICDNDIEFNTSIICGDIECEFKSRTINMDDNFVINFIKNNEKESLFLLSSAIWALKSEKSDILYNPVPYYHNSSIEFSEIKEILLSKLNKYSKIDFLLKELKEYNNDNDLYENYDIYFYGFLKFTLKSNMLEIKLDNIINMNSFYIYNVNYFNNNNEEFNNLKKEKGKCYLFHGSDINNWYSIMLNGLKIFSNTDRMKNGAAHGIGIYLSDNLNLSESYSTSNQSNNVVGVFEVIGNKSLYKKTSIIYVVNNDKLLQLKYIFWKKKLSSYSSTIADINNYFNNQITIEESKVDNYMTNIKNKRLLKEVKHIQKLDSNELGIEFEINEDNFFKWNVYLINIDENSGLYKDMTDLNIDKIKMEIEFPNNYPLYPPFLRIIEPRFEYRTGHITLGGSICMELLTNQGWSPAYSIENLIIHIKSLIIEGEGQIDKAKFNIPYSYDEAKNAFKRMLISHNWK